MDYFSKTDRIVQIDVTCGVQEIIWSKVCDFFIQLNFEAKKTPETVIVFGFGKIAFFIEQIGAVNYAT